MKYIENNLMKNEVILYKATVHWFVFVPGLCLIVLGCMFLDSFGLFVIAYGCYSFIGAIIAKFTTELAITSRRIIAKFGLIRRETIELNHNKVESFNIHQSVLGRILNFGTLIICGTGGAKTPIPIIDSPLDFRREAMKVIDPI
ncbi:MAG: PH domain-containing protein [Alphaproteobacteria bacterium]